MKNKVIIDLWLESGCSQSEGEVNISWKPINFTIYSKLFIDMIYEAADAWLLENTLETEQHHELIMHHIVERDGAGAVHTEYFDVINHEVQTY